MPRSRAFRAAGWELLEGRDLTSAVVGPLPMVSARGAGAIAGGGRVLHRSEASPARGEIVLLGDSMIWYWPTRGAASWQSVMAPRGAINLGVYGTTTKDVLAEVNGGEIPGRPKVVVLEIGVNDLVRGSTPLQTAWGIA